MKLSWGVAQQWLWLPRLDLNWWYPQLSIVFFSMWPADSHPLFSYNLFSFISPTLAMLHPPAHPLPSECHPSWLTIGVRFTVAWPQHARGCLRSPATRMPPSLPVIQLPSRILRSVFLDHPGTRCHKAGFSGMQTMRDLHVGGLWSRVLEISATGEWRKQDRAEGKLNCDAAQWKLQPMPRKVLELGWPFSVVLK